MNNFKFYLFSNFTLIFLLIYLIHVYNIQSEIILKREYIKYVFLEKYCYNGGRLRSQLKILYNNKTYYVDVNSKICRSFNIENEAEIKFYYNKDRDIVFIENEINKFERGIKVLIGLILINTFYLIYKFIRRPSLDRSTAPPNKHKE